MSPTEQRYDTLADAFAAKVAAVRDHRWSATTPCEDWTVRDVVQHVVDSQGMFLGLVGESPGDVPSVAEDPVGAFAAASGAIRRRLADPALATTEFDGFFGRTSFEQAVDRFLCTDLVVHGWDVATATGQDATIDGAEVERVRAQAEAFGDALRGRGAFGPEIDPPEGADAQTRLLAYLGRRP